VWLMQSLWPPRLKFSTSWGTMALLRVARRVLAHSVRKQGTWGQRPWQLKQPVDLISSHSWAGNSGSLQLNPRHYSPLHVLN